MVLRAIAMNGEPWHLDKRVPVAIIFALLVQTAGAVWWASAMSSNVASLREADARLEAADVQIRLEANAHEVRIRNVENSLTRADERLIAIQEGINEIKRELASRP
jgi:hypothetical protein